MKTNLLCLRKNELRGLHAEIAVCDAAAPYGLEEENCKSFSNEESFFRCLSEISEEGTLTILAVDTEVFLSTKSALFSALSLNCEYSKTISERINPDTAERKKHCEVPAGATVLPSDDGLFSGFAFKKGKYNIVFLPLGDKITQQCLGDSFYNYLEPTDEVKSVAENNDNDMSDVLNVISESALDACRILRDMGFQAALSVSLSAEKICNLLPKMDEIKFLHPPIERNNFSPKNYAAQLAREAAARSGVKIGASITNAFKVQADGETKVFLCVAVADSEAAKVKKIYAQPNEAPIALTVCAIETVLDMIKGQAVRGKTVISEDDEDKISVLAPSITKNTRKKITAGTICAGATALVLCLSIAVGAIIINHNDVPVSTKPGTTQENIGADDEIPEEYKNFWDYLFSSDKDEESDDVDSDEDTPYIDGESDNNGTSHGNSSDDETSASNETQPSTNPSEPGTGTTERPTEQPTGESPTESRPTEPGTEKPTEAPTEPTTEAPTEPTTEAPTEPPTQSPTEPTTEPSTEPPAPSSEPSAENENIPVPQDLQ